MAKEPPRASPDNGQVRLRGTELLSGAEVPSVKATQSHPVDSAVDSPIRNTKKRCNHCEQVSQYQADAALLLLYLATLHQKEIISLCPPGYWNL